MGMPAASQEVCPWNARFAAVAAKPDVAVTNALRIPGLAPLPVGDHLQTRHPTELRGVRRNKGEFVLQARCGDPQVVRADERAPLT
jgi:epoxyqueuosine reductase QueG